MTRYLVFFLIFLTSLLSDDSCRVFGDKENKLSGVIKEKSVILWQFSDGKWSVSLPKESIDLSKQNCSNRDYALLSNENISYKTPKYKKNSYTLRKGWNYLPSHDNGVDIEKTFGIHKEIEFVYVYDKISKAWAGYSSDAKIRAYINTARIISLEDIEANTGFYVYSNKNLILNIKSKEINSVCKKYTDDSLYLTLIDSGTNSDVSYSQDKSIGLKSRYVLHYKRGIYSDSRVMLIYPKAEVSSKKFFKYGPAKPKSLIVFDKKYEGKEFYMYSYKDEKCFKGIFPSKMVPPFSSLKELN